MAGIAGIAKPAALYFTRQSMEKILHRGKGPARVVENDTGSVGEVASRRTNIHSNGQIECPVVIDGTIFNWQKLCPDAGSCNEAILELYKTRGPVFVKELDGPFAIAIMAKDGLFMARDTLGIAPLYYGMSDHPELCFASEVKALSGIAQSIREFPPGHFLHPGVGLVCFDYVARAEPEQMPATEAARQVKDTLEIAVTKCVEANDGDIGCWLSGGLDSSALAALASRQVPGLQTFAVGLEGAPDLEYARAVARYIGAQHNELIVTPDEMLKILPEVIYHLESYDALLVRSSVTNFLVGDLASQYVPAVFSGEGGDELFAGYQYLKHLEPETLADELLDITNRLHNTALQRVDRCSASHGLTAHTAFLHRDVVDTALAIPSEYKMYCNGSIVEKWILRMALAGMLPDDVLMRPKAKFWEGAGVMDIMERYISDTISDDEFEKGRILPNGSRLNTKEEMYYYRIFREHFGDVDEMLFMGRTKGAPVA